MVAWIFPVGDSRNSAKSFSSPEQCPFLFCSDTSGHHVDHAGNKVGDNSVEMGIHFFDWSTSIPGARKSSDSRRCSFSEGRRRIRVDFSSNSVENGLEGYSGHDS